jgi:hypothetical protein
MDYLKASIQSVSVCEARPSAASIAALYPRNAWSLEMMPLVRGVLGEVRAQARHSAGEVAQVYAARGLAHLARTGFFNPVHVKSLRADALRSLIIARKKLVGHYDFVRRAGPHAWRPVTGGQMGSDQRMCAAMT